MENMTDEDYLRIVKEILFTESKIKTGGTFSVGSSPKDLGLNINDLNEIDIAFAKKGIQVKCFYDKLTKSNNSSPFYIGIKKDEIIMWVSAGRAFSKEPESTSILDKIKQKGAKSGW